MTNINIEINDETHKKFKAKCAEEGLTVKDGVIKLIDEKVEE